MIHISPLRGLLWQHQRFLSIHHAAYHTHAALGGLLWLFMQI